MMLPPDGIGEAGVKANVTVAHVERATRSEEAMENDIDATDVCVVAGANDETGACDVARVVGGGASIGMHREVLES